MSVELRTSDVMFNITTRLLSSTSILLPITTCILLALVPLPNLQSVPYKRESLRIHWASLDQKLIPPAVQRLKTLRVIHVVYQNAAIRASVERHAQTLETFLSCCVPDLCPLSSCPHVVYALGWTITDLHGNQSIVDEYFFGEEVGAYRCFVRCAELLVDILVHQTRLSDAGVTENLGVRSVRKLS